MSLHAFFDGQDYLHRVSFISGGTDDTYYVNGVLLNSMEYMLEMHLRQIGYDVILFYNGVQGLYCFTRQSAELRDRYFRQPVGEDLNLDSDMAELFGTDGTATPAPESREAPLQIPMSDLEIPGFADKVMRETRVRCALVFSDGWDLLENTNDNAQRTLSNRMRSWYHLESGNHNICLFCFADLSQQHLSDFLRRSLHWSFLEEKILDGQSSAASGEDEIRQLLASREEYNHATRAEAGQAGPGGPSAAAHHGQQSARSVRLSGNTSPTPLPGCWMPWRTTAKPWRRCAPPGAGSPWLKPSTAWPRRYAQREPSPRPSPGRTRCTA